MSAVSTDPVVVGILLLAAGRSRRFGSDKRRARLAHSDRTVLQMALDAVTGSGLPTRVCLRPDDSALAEALASQGIDALQCQRAHEGMGATLAEGVTRVTEWQGVIIALADMPRVLATTYRELARHSTQDAAIVPVYRGQRGNPVCFGASWYARLMQCAGQSGARHLLEAHPQGVSHLAVDDPGVLRDVDYPGDLGAMR